MLSPLLYLCVFINIQLFANAFENNEYDELSLQNWDSFKMQFNKVYESSEDDQIRMKIYLKNAAMITDHNERFKKGEVSFELGMNQFGDLTSDEFADLYTSRTTDPIQNDNYTQVIFSTPYPTPVPKSKNWVYEGAVTPVKNQGACGSSWAFASAGVLESHVFISNKKTKPVCSLSAQNLLDCVKTMDGCHDSCKEGSVGDAMKYIKKYGIATDESYPYCGKEKSCASNSVHGATKIKKYNKIQACNEPLLKKVVGLIGPVTCSMDATDEKFKFYKTGVYQCETCSKTKVNQALVIVGYGCDEYGNDYWLVKNSWGCQWGEKGYAKILRNRNVCGIESHNIYPKI